MQDLTAAARQWRLERAKQKTRAKTAVKPDHRYKQWQRTYRGNEVAAVHDLFEWSDGQAPTFYQDEIIDSLFQHKRVTVRGPHGLGKTTLASWCILVFALTRDGESDWKIPTTASNWRQLTKFLWPEIHKWSRKIKWDRVGRDPFNNRLELQTLNLRLQTGEAFAVASDTPGYIEGAHADSLLYIFDEAKLIPAVTFDAAEGAFSGAGTDTSNEAYALAISTPGETSGRFYDIHTHKAGFEDWKTRHVTLQEAIKAGRISSEWAAARARQWGEKSAIYQNRVEGEFADSDETNLIPLSWVEAAHSRWIEYDGQSYEGAVTSYGVDPARFGDDKTAIVKLVGDVVEYIEYHSREDTMQTSGRIAAALGDDTETAIGIDSNGLGAGVFDRLAELGYNVTSFNVLEATDLTDSTGTNKFNNLRSAILWAVRELLDPDNPDALALPDDDLLTADLVALTWGFTSRGAIVVESKDAIKKRLGGRSPDGADALALAVYAATPQVWSMNI